MILAIRSERASFMAAADQFRSTGAVPGSGGGTFPGTRIPGAQGWIMKDEAQGLILYNRLLQASGPREMIDEAKKIEMEVAGTGQMSALTRNLFPSFSRALTLLVRGTAEMRCAQVGVAAERYRLATGEWPTDLQRLVPDYITRIPEDPFDSAKPLRLARKDDRFIVYSIGPDRQDNGGALLRGTREDDSLDAGFILLDAAARNQAPLPASAGPATQPAAGS
jgi:hypothetical protein